MFRNFWLSLMMGAALQVGALAADVVVRIGPPRPIVERRVVAPGRGYVWVSGYHRWDGRAYAWEPGRWERPPQGHRSWVAHHWVRRNGGWVLVGGHWR